MTDVDVCYSGCGALANIMDNGQQHPMKTKEQMNITADNQAKAGKLGAIDFILDALKTNTADEDVCVYGCKALWNYTKNGNNFNQHF